MDCKRLNTYRALRQLFSIVCIMAMMSCTWVKDDNDDCPYGFWLKLNYTYNMLDIEAAQKYVEDASVYIFDAEGNFVKSMHIDHAQLINNGYRIRVEDIPEGDYQFVIWSGIYEDEQFVVTDDDNTIDDFRLSLIATNELIHRYSGTLPNVFHGYLSSVHFDDSYAVHNIDLTKNTNTLSCLVVSVDNDAVMNSDDYNLRIVCENSIMDAYNNLVSNVALTYEPDEKGSVVFNDVDYGLLRGIQFRIPTLRLTTDSDDRIILEKKDGSQKLFDISLSEYIGKMGTLYQIKDKTFTVQDYLDRQDYFTVVFYLSEDLETLISLKIENWKVRTNNHLNL